MKIGIDFGTSNSAAAAVVDGRVVPIRFGEAEQFRTTVYFPEVMRDPNDFELTPALEHELARLIDAAARDARAAGQERAPDALRREALRVVRRQWMEEQMRAPLSSTKLLQNAVYGDWKPTSRRTKATWCRARNRCWATTCTRARARPSPVSPRTSWSTSG